MTQRPIMPGQVSRKVGVFDRFAEHASRFAARAWFFCFCVVLVVIWAPSIALLRSLNTWQLLINTVTTIVTFLLVALLQNTQQRSDQATQHKLNAMAEALSLMLDERGMDQGAADLRDAIGLEQRESSSHNNRSEE